MEEQMQERKETKMSKAFKEGREIDLIGLWSEIGGSTTFGIDKILSMASICHDNEEDFLVNHSDVHYRVPLESLSEYFATHRKPEHKLDMHQENIRLKKQIEDLEGLIDSLNTGKEVSIPIQRKKGTAETDFLRSFEKDIGSTSPVGIDAQISRSMGDLDPGKMKAELKAQESAGIIDDGPTPEEIEAAKKRGPISPEEGMRDAKETLGKIKPITNPANDPL